MDNQDLIDRIKQQMYSGKRSQAQKEEDIERLYGTLDRFCTYLRDVHGIERIEGTTLEALRLFDFDLFANDDYYLRLVCSELGRRDLIDYLGMVSADKYFRNKKLTVVFKAMYPLRSSIALSGGDPVSGDVADAAELAVRGLRPRQSWHSRVGIRVYC